MGWGKKFKKVASFPAKITKPISTVTGGINSAVNSSFVNQTFGKVPIVKNVTSLVQAGVTVADTGVQGINKVAVGIDSMVRPSGSVPTVAMGYTTTEYQATPAGLVPVVRESAPVKLQPAADNKMIYIALAGAAALFLMSKK